MASFFGPYEVSRALQLGVELHLYEQSNAFHLHHISPQVCSLGHNHTFQNHFLLKK